MVVVRPKQAAKKERGTIMLDENSRQNIRRHINTLCRTALEVIEVMGIDGESDLVDRLGQTADAIAAQYEMEPELMENFHAIIDWSRKRISLDKEDICYNDAENTKEMIYTLCDSLNDPKDIMCHVRTADEMMAVWESERNS